MAKKKTDEIDEETDIEFGPEGESPKDHESGAADKDLEPTTRPVGPNPWDHGPGRAKT